MWIAKIIDHIICAARETCFFWNCARTFTWFCYCSIFCCWKQENKNVQGNLKYNFWNIHRVASNLWIFIGIIQSHSFANGGVIREKAYMLRVYKEEKPFKVISNSHLSYMWKKSNKMCYRNVPKYPTTNVKFSW